MSDKFSYLLGLANHNNIDYLCKDSSAEYGDRYNGGILCKAELRALKIYTRGLRSGSAPRLKVEVWYNSGGVSGQIGNPDSSQLVGFHQVGADFASSKQGYSVPVIPGRDHSYKLSLTNGNLPDDWVIEFSDPVIGNRWSQDELVLSVAGRNCGNNGLITSQHDRKFIWGGNGYLDDEAWYNHGACVGSGNQPPDESIVDCNAQNNNKNNRNLREGSSEATGIIQATQCPGECPGGCDTSNSYCDCGSKTCTCKAGFVGSSCDTDLCAAADCGEHGSCASRYLGGEMSVTDSNTKCICEGTWQGEKCDKNPCQELGLDCSGKGTCIALSDTQATCECQDGYSGPYCDVRSPCEGFCESGSFPYFGCGSNIGSKVALGCFRTGGCYYLSEGQGYPYDGFCTYKTYGTNAVFSTENDNASPTPSPMGQAPPTPSPIGQAPPTPSPVLSNPTSNLTPRCGCETCTEDVWERMADGYTCGSRISFVRYSDQETLLGVDITSGPFDEEGACRFVTNEFPNICTCYCAENDNASPTPSPIGQASPTPSPVVLNPIPIPTWNPTSNLTPRCGCETCTEDVWERMADGYTCGSRIGFVRDSDKETLLGVDITTGPFDEEGACRFVTNEFPNICTCHCSAEEKDPTGSPTISPTISPTFSPTFSPTKSPTISPTISPTFSPTISPTRAPTPSPPTLGPTVTTEDQSVSNDVNYYCGCDKCTEQVWNTNADGYNCGDRISFVRDSDTDTLVSVGITTGGPFDEAGACRFVSEEFPEICTCSCEDEQEGVPQSPQPPSVAPTIISPTKQKPSPYLCGCAACTEKVWNTVVDGYRCGDRISFVRDSSFETLSRLDLLAPNGDPFDEAGACRFVTDQFPDVCTCSCEEEDEDEGTDSILI